MNPSELRQRRGAPSAPLSAPSERILQRRPRSGTRPEWNTLQQDHSKFRLTADEIRRRKESRAPRPLNSQPLLGDKHITEQKHAASAPRCDRPENRNVGGHNLNSSATQISQMLRSLQASGHPKPTEYVINDVEGSLMLKESRRGGASQPRTPILNSEDYKDTDHSQPNSPLVKPGQRDPCGHLAVLQAVLQKVNAMSQQIEQLTERLTTTEEELGAALSENLELKQEVERLRRDVRRQQEVSTGQEYIAMEEVLDRLKLI